MKMETMLDAKRSPQKNNKDLFEKDTSPHMTKKHSTLKKKKKAKISKVERLDSQHTGIK